nr:F-box only protein 8-like [Ipomoea batatas]GMD77758.1 F-box only protein 8-like [Ipomoea batatas]
MKGSSASISSITCLPRDIVVKILSGLPAKCAVRFRCSSKFFYSYIPKPRLAFKIVIVLPSTIHYSDAYPASSRLYSVSYSEEDDRVQKLDARGLEWSAGSSCAPDGKMMFLLLHEIIGFLGALFDLSTGRSVFLPPHNVMCFGVYDSDNIGNGDFVSTRKRSSSGLCFFAGLGFDSISERYKVFASEMYYNVQRHWVLTLGVDKSWREIRCTTITGHIDSAVHIHGVIYFIPHITEQESSSKIVAMDVASEKVIGFIPFPYAYHQSRQRGWGWVPWIKLNGRLGFIDIIIVPAERKIGESKIEIWTLEIRSMGEEWEKKQTVLLPLEESEVIRRATSMRFTFNSIGEIVMLLLSNTIVPPLILIYSFRRDVWRRIEICGVSECSSYLSVVRVDDEIAVSFLE